jgi:hypothetical protein
MRLRQMLLPMRGAALLLLCGVQRVMCVRVHVGREAPGLVEIVLIPLCSRPLGYCYAT